MKATVVIPENIANLIKLSQSIIYLNVIFFVYSYCNNFTRSGSQIVEK